MTDLASIQQKIIAFRNERDWAQFHDPKNLAEALSIEAGELLENFLWKTTEHSRNLTAEELKNVNPVAARSVGITVLIDEKDTFEHPFSNNFRLQRGKRRTGRHFHLPGLSL